MIKIEFKEAQPIKQNDGNVFECIHCFCNSIIKKNTDMQMFSIQLVNDELHFFNDYFWCTIKSITVVSPTDL